jgi:hypothetical protein
MKKLLPALGLLAACTSGSVDNSTHKAISDYLQKTLANPASYQAVSWGKATPWRQQDLDAETAVTYLMQGYQERRTLRAVSQHFSDLRNSSRTPKEVLAELAKAKPLLAFIKYREDSIRRLYNKAKTSTDTTRLGTVVVHAYRAKNKLGAFQLHSATFTVLKTGEVQMQQF